MLCNCNYCLLADYFNAQANYLSKDVLSSIYFLNTDDLMCTCDCFGAVGKHI